MKKLGALLVFGLVLLAAARGDEEPSRELVCPFDGARVPARFALSTNESGGRDADGCRWAVDDDGRLEVLELRELVACPRCKAALYRGHLDAAARLKASVDEAGIVKLLSVAGVATELRLAHLDTVVAHAVATYRLVGHAALGVTEDPDAFDGRLWLRAAWGARMRIVRDDEPQPRGSAPPLRFVPRTPAEAMARLADIMKDAIPNETALKTPVEDALSSLDQARSVLDPLDDHAEPSRRYAFERVRGALDSVEQTLLVIRQTHNTDAQLAASVHDARAFELEVARFAQRAGDGPQREFLMAQALNPGAPADIVDDCSRLRSLIQLEDGYLALAAASLKRAAARASGERATGLYALAAEATRRTIVSFETDKERIEAARELAEHAAAGTGPAAELGRFILAWLPPK